MKAPCLVGLVARTAGGPILEPLSHRLNATSQDPPPAVRHVTDFARSNLDVGGLTYKTGGSRPARAFRMGELSGTGGGVAGRALTDQVGGEHLIGARVAGAARIDGGGCRADVDRRPERHPAQPPAGRPARAQEAGEKVAVKVLFGPGIRALISSVFSSQ